LVDATLPLEYTEGEASQYRKQGKQMEKPIPVQITEKGLLIPHEVLGEWGESELEAVREEDRIVIRPKLDQDERIRVAQTLRAAGLLYEPDWEQPLPVSEKERARLARKLASGSPLSEMIIADRKDRG
jgi:hypothetical protein